MIIRNLVFGGKFMLKERIEFLCRKKSMTRKELVEGLVTGAHFANILAERYPLHNDLAASLADRLGVKSSYITDVSRQDDLVIDQAERIFNELSGMVDEQTEQQILSLEDRDDALVVELTIALIKAVYYKQVDDPIAYQYIHDSYLNFYLEKYLLRGSNEVKIPLPLKKAFLLYKIYELRAQNEYTAMLYCVQELVPLIKVGSDTWYTVQSLYMEASVHTEQYEQATILFEQLLGAIHKDKSDYRLSALYIAHSGNYFARGAYEEALLALAKAEEHLNDAYQPNKLLDIILNNRIVMLTMSGKSEAALEQIQQYETLLANQPTHERTLSMSTIQIYRSELAYLQKDWVTLSELIEGLEDVPLNEDMEMAKVFYKSQLALANGDSDSFLKYTLTCLPYFEQSLQKLRLEQLYELLAIISEENRKYKDAAIYYRKLLDLVRRNQDEKSA